MRRRHGSLYIYIAREFVFSFLVSFLFFFFIFFLNQLLLLAEDILAKHVAFPDVALLVIYSLPAIVAISFPFASLVGALMAVGRLSSDNEILALQASGVSSRSIFLPLFALGLIFSVVSFIMNDYFLPLGTIKFGELYTKVLYANPELELEPYSVKRYQDSTLVTGDVRAGKISDLVIFDTTDQKDKRVITARTSSLTVDSEQRGIVSLKLDDVFSLTPAQDKQEQFDYSTAREMLYNILLSDINVSIRAPTAREMSSIDVYRLVQRKESDLKGLQDQQSAKTRLAAYALSQAYWGASMLGLAGALSPQSLKEVEQTYSDYVSERDKPVVDRSLLIDKIELNRKFSVPFACIAFVIFAFPVGLLTRRSGRSVGFGIGLFVSILYWGMLVAGQTLGYRTDSSPAFSMWFPNIVILVFGTIFFALRLRR